MAYDEGLAQRIRELLEDDPRVAEKKMFGGVAFLVDGHMACGIIRDELMVRVGPEAHAEAVAQPFARAMDFTKRPMRGFVQVRPDGFESDADLASWVARGIGFAGSPETAPAVRAARAQLSGGTARPQSAGRPARSKSAHRAARPKAARRTPKPAAKRRPKSAPKRSPE